MEDSPFFPNKPNPNTYIQLDLDGNGNQAIGKAIDSTIVNGQVIYLTINDRIQAPLIPPSNIVVQQLTYEEDRQRRVLLNRVKEDWVEGVLEKSLHERVSIELGLQKRPDLVKKTFSDVDEFVDAPGQALAEGTPATTVFDRMGSGRTLLIVGEPGAGKTIALLKLAKDIIARTELDLRQQIPVVFNLSSWARKPQSIEQWLIQELWERYQIPKILGKTWVESQALILLLDGLDEVKAEQRNACVQALNKFMQIHVETEIVICCRIGDYQMLQDRLRLRSAICIQPLTTAQIEQYFKQAGDRLSALKAVLKQDEEFQKLAKSPLMLSVMSLAYKDFKPEHLTVGGTIEDYRKQLFDTYIDRMFRRRKKITQSQVEYCREKEDAKRWLAWLAQRMKAASQSEFLIERLQPSWLSDKRQRRESDRYAACILLLINILIFQLTFREFIGVDSKVSYWFIVVLFLVFSSLAMTYFWVVTKGDIEPVENIKWSSQSFRNEFRRNKFRGVIFGVIFGVTFGVIFGVFLRVVDEVILELINEWVVRLIDQLSSYLTTLIAILFDKPFYRLISIPSLGLSFGIIFGLIGMISVIIAGLIMGFQKTEIQQKQKPNQGIFRSALNAVIIGMLSYLIIVIPCTLLFGGLFGNFFELLFVEYFGLSFGGNAVLRHFALRFTLYRKRYAPWNYARFLDYATERLFLQKVGGGYIFIHRMLLEHFAEMSIEQKK